MKRIVYLLISLLSLTLRSQVSTSWLKTHNYNYYTCGTGVSSFNSAIFFGGYFLGSNNSSAAGVFLSKYDLSGNLIWVDTSFSKFAVNSTGVVSDVSGNAYMAIWLWGNNSIKIGSSIFNSSNNMLLVKYSSNGQVLWVVPQGNSSEPRDIAIDKQGNVYVAGLCNGGGFITKYNSAGSCILNVPLSGYAYGIELDTAENIYVKSAYHVLKFSPSGTLLWSFNSGPGVMAIDPSGNAYLSSGGSYFNSPLMKLSPTGQHLWTLYKPFEGSYGIHSDSHGDIYTSGLYGSGNTSAGIETNKYDSNGNLIWMHQETAPVYKPTNMITYNDGIYISAYDVGSSGKGVLIKLNEPGQTLSVHENKLSDKLIVSPNPSCCNFSIFYKNDKEKGSVVLKVYDTQGKIVINKTYKNFTGEISEVIDLSTYAKGIYILEITGSDMKQTRQLVVE